MFSTRGTRWRKIVWIEFTITLVTFIFVDDTGVGGRRLNATIQFAWWKYRRRGYRGSHCRLRLDVYISWEGPLCQAMSENWGYIMWKWWWTRRYTGWWSWLSTSGYARWQMDQLSCETRYPRLYYLLHIEAVVTEYLWVSNGSTWQWITLLSSGSLRVKSSAVRASNLMGDFSPIVASQLTQVISECGDVHFHW